MHSYIYLLATFSLSLPATIASAGEVGSYALVDTPHRAFAHADAYTAGQLSLEEEHSVARAAQESGDQNAPVQRSTVQQNTAEQSQSTRPAQSSDSEAKPEGDDEAQVRRYRSAAESGDPVAMARLGMLFQQGIGVPQNYAEAINWYTHAARDGDADAMNNLGTLYFLGQGVRQDYAEAKKWYERAGDSGSVTAMCNIAKMYYFGVGVARSYPEAAGWFQRASIRGSASAMNSLSLMYGAGIGVSQDLGTALSLVKEAVRLGYGPAMANLGDMYEEGAGIEANHFEAYAWIVAALKRGVPDEARDALIYRLGAISTRLDPQELAHAQQLGAERATSPAAARPVSQGGSANHTSRLNR